MWWWCECCRLGGWSSGMRVYVVEGERLCVCVDVCECVCVCL